MRISEFLQEKNGQFSSTRLLFLVWGLCVLVTWMFISIKSNVMQSVDWSVVGILFTFMTGKVWQKYKEK